MRAKHVQFLHISTADKKKATLISQLIDSVLFVTVNLHFGWGEVEPFFNNNTFIEGL